MKNIVQIVLFIFFIQLSVYAKSVAHITALKGDVSIVTLQGTAEASLGEELDPSDRVITGNNSLAQIVFTDETIVSLGKNSNFLIQEYIFSSQKDSSVKFGLVQGAMRTITGYIGKVSPKKFKVSTKTATIGIRGTNFTIIDEEDGEEKVYCSYGAVEVSKESQNRVVNKNYILSQTPSGEVEKTVISSRMLDVNRKSFFGGDALAYSKASDSSALNRETLLDNITQDISRIINDETSNDTKDASESQKSALADAASKTVSMTGWGANSTSTEKLATLNLEATSEGNGFTTNSSLQDKVSTSETWDYSLSGTPTVYNSKNDFTSSFSSVAPSNTNNALTYNSSVIDPAKNYFKTTTDISSNDYMSWGEWGIKVNYSVSVGVGVSFTTYNATRDVDGVWVAGELTQDSVIASYTQSTASYSGSYIGYDASKQSISAPASMSVNFATDSATLNINRSDAQSTIWRTYDMSGANTNHISGSSTAGGVADGNFYGPKGQNIGGNFTVVNGTSTLAKGVYEVSTTDVLK